LAPVSKATESPETAKKVAKENLDVKQDVDIDL